MITPRRHGGINVGGSGDGEIKETNGVEYRALWSGASSPKSSMSQMRRANIQAEQKKKGRANRLIVRFPIRD